MMFQIGDSRPRRRSELSVVEPNCYGDGRRGLSTCVTGALSRRDYDAPRRGGGIVGISAFDREIIFPPGGQLNRSRPFGVHTPPPCPVCAPTARPLPSPR